MTPKTPWFHKHLGLTRNELSSLSFRRAFETLASLRDCWVGAGDKTRRMLIVEAIKTLFSIDVVQAQRDLALRVMKYGLEAEQKNQLLNEMYPMPWGKDR